MASEIVTSLPVYAAEASTSREPLIISEIHPKVLANSSCLAENDVNYNPLQCEYIELYNPNDSTATTEGYELRYDPENKNVDLLAGKVLEIPARSYRTIQAERNRSLADTGGTLHLIWNSQLVQKVEYTGTLGSGEFSWLNTSQGWLEGYSSPNTENIIVTEQPEPEIETKESSQIDITEVAKAYGDSGMSYIELYNPNERAVDIKNYLLRQIDTAGTSDKVFEASLVIESGKYAIIPLVSSDHILNADGHAELYAADSRLVSQAEPHGELKPGTSWAHDGDSWKITTTPTPAAENIITLPRSAPLFISELLPNPDGLDSGNEFIELYNPTTESIRLNGYELEVGAKRYLLGSEEVIPSGGYAVLHDSDVGYTLTNTAQAISLYAPSGDRVSGPISYTNAPSGQSWAEVDGIWQFTSSITEGVKNSANVAEDSEAETVHTETAMLAPCPAGKYRNPLTNRCRNIEDDAAVVAACDDGEYRNPETNRCRRVVLASASLTPCKEGQLRNPETNRCKSIASEVASLIPCDEGYERNPDTNRCRKIKAAAFAAAPIGDKSTFPADPSKMVNSSLLWMVAAIGAVGYAAYESRDMMAKGVAKVMSFVPFTHKPL